MLALYEMLSTEGYTDYRDIILERAGDVSFTGNLVFNFELTISENRHDSRIRFSCVS